MTRVMVTPAILGILVTAMVTGALPTGCSSNKTGLSQQKMDAQAPGVDAPVGSGGTAGAGSDAASGGGITGGGGVAATGGTTQTGGSIGFGGATQTGGSTGSGGARQTGGSIGFGGATQTGGSIGFGGATQTGGSTGFGGVTQTGGSARSGGATQTGGSTGTGGSKGSTGGSGGIACTGSGCYQVDAGCTGSGCPKDAGTTDAAPGSCVQVTTRDECDRRNDCHSVFVDPGNCACLALGCCAKFSRCADGGRAKCSGMPICEMAPPHCEGSFVLAYAGNCWEGCVSQDECAGADAGITAPTCPQTPPANASSCGSAGLTCFYDNCPSGGRTQAVCAGGNWTVETAACGTVTCDPDPSGSAHTCSSGQMCVIVNSGYFSYACMGNACTTSPVSQNQVPAQCTNMSTCSVHYSLTHGVTFLCPSFVCPPFCV
jgi:hypothetical protein